MFHPDGHNKARNVKGRGAGSNPGKCKFRISVNYEKKVRVSYAEDISFDDFMAQAGAQQDSGKSAVELAADQRAADEQLQKKLRALKKAKQVGKKH